MILLILNSFVINKVPFNILDFPTPIIAMDPRVYYLPTHIDVKTRDNIYYSTKETHI